METKICSKCKVEKPLTEFYTRKDRGKATKRRDCIVCKLNSDREYIQRNREKKAKRDKEYHIKNRAKRLEYHKWYWAEHRASKKDYEKFRKQEYYLNNKEKVSLRVNKYRHTDNGKNVNKKSTANARNKLYDHYIMNCLLQNTHGDKREILKEKINSDPRIIEFKRYLIKIHRAIRNHDKEQQRHI